MSIFIILILRTRCISVNSKVMEKMRSRDSEVFCQFFLRGEGLWGCERFGRGYTFLGLNNIFLKSF